MADERFWAALIVGVPGAGKGTQGEILARIPGFFHCSSGEIFRRLSTDSEDGRIVREVTARGELVPDPLTVRVWRSWLDHQRARGRFVPAQQLLLLDGIPRNRNQCLMLESHIDVRCIVHLVCHDEDAMIERIRRRAAQENRTDDLDEVIIRRRFEVYRRETAPVLDYYPPHLIHEVESAGLVAEVLLQTLSHLVPALRERVLTP